MSDKSEENNQVKETPEINEGGDVGLSDNFKKLNMDEEQTSPSNRGSRGSGYRGRGRGRGFYSPRGYRGVRGGPRGGFRGRGYPGPRRYNNDNRRRDDASGDEEAREIDPKTICRLLIPTRYAGVVIGKGGSVVNNLRQQFQCQVAIPYANGPERIVRVMSEDINNVLDCVKEVMTLLSEDMRRVCNLKEDYTEIRILVHQSQCGNIIGPGGEKINNLRESSKCSIKMNGECCPGSTDRVCQIAGLPEDVFSCLSTIFTDIQSVPLKGSDIRYNPEHFDERYEYGGFKSYQVDALPGPGGRAPRAFGDAPRGHPQGRGGYYRINNRR